MSISIFDKNTGVIEETISRDETQRPPVIDEVRCAVIDGVFSPLLFYINVDTPGAYFPVEKTAIPYSVDKTTFNAGNDDSVNFTGLPEGCSVVVAAALGGGRVSSAAEDALGSVFTLSTDLATTYTVALTHPLYLDATLTVTAV